MDTPKHTPGPWGLTASKNGEHAHLSDKSNEDDIALIEIIGDRGNANARLIAAAPDLLRALEGLREDMRMLRDDEWIPDNEGEACQCAIDVADSAINKATT